MLQDLNKEYLKAIKNTSFLDKKEQIDIARIIKKNEIDLLKACIAFKDFKQELLTLEGNLKRFPGNLFRYSRLVDSNSTQEETQKVEKDFKSLFNALKKGKEKSALRCLLQVKLTSSLIAQLIAPIKEKFSAYQEHQSIIDNALKFLEAENVKELNEILSKFNDLAYKKELTQRLSIPLNRLSSYLWNVGESISFLSKLNEGGQELVSLYETIVNLEEKVESQRRLLITNNLPLVLHRAKFYKNKGLDFEDLVQEGTLGLIRAVDKYDPERDIKLNTYAQWWVELALKRAVANKSKTVRMPIHIQGMRDKIHKSYNQLSHKLGRFPSYEEISKDSGVSLENISLIGYSFLNDSEISDTIEDNLAFIEYKSLDSGDSVFNETQKSLLKDYLRTYLAYLPPRSEKILRLRYGIGEPDPMELGKLSKKLDLNLDILEGVEGKERTLKEIGELQNLSKERVKQVINKEVSNIKKDKRFLKLVEE
ncbi:MAG: RNA polymerase sigma factor RpoD [Candidatus Omnitrophica bacterium]|nr:RNA polymerase sigma factor RpoD [Candidatus Omnitrophota bacterium]